MTDFQTRRTMMVNTQVRPADVTKFPVIQALLNVPREGFVPDARREAAYADDLTDLGNGRYILDARGFAKMLDALDVQPDELVLDIGAGMGYSAAVLGQLAQTVVAVEENETLAQDGETALGDHGAHNVVMVQGALAEGAAKYGPFDVIVVEGAVDIMPNTIIDQLAEGGRIAAIFNDGIQGDVRIGYKIDGQMSWQFAFNAGAPVLPGFEKHHMFTF